MKKNVGATWELPAKQHSQYPAHFHPNGTGLTLLFSRQLPNGSHDFFSYFQHKFSNLLIKYPQMPLYLCHIFFSIGGVSMIWAICFF